MMKESIMSHLYTTKVTAVGGRSGIVKSDDGVLDLPLAMPKELGGKGGATNPEQLFAAGYAACFENAVIHVTRAQAGKVRDNDIEVVGEVGLLPARACGHAQGGRMLPTGTFAFRRAFFDGITSGAK